MANDSKKSSINTLENILLILSILNLTPIIKDTAKSIGKKADISRRQDFRVSGFQGFRVSGFQGFKILKFQDFKVSKI